MQVNAWLNYLPDRLCEAEAQLEEATKAKEAAETTLAEVRTQVEQDAAELKAVKAQLAATKKEVAGLKATSAKQRHQLEEAQAKAENAVPEFLKSQEYMDRRVEDARAVHALSAVTAALQYVERYKVKYFAPDLHRKMGVVWEGGVAKPPQGIEGDNAEGTDAPNANPELLAADAEKDKTPEDPPASETAVNASET